MTIKQQGGIFGRHPVFAEVEAKNARFNEITEETAGSGVTVEGVLLKDSNIDIASNANQMTISPSDRATYGRLDIGHFTNGVFIGTYAGTDTASDVIRLGTSGTEHLRLEGGNVTVKTGNLVIGTSGKGIDFSATSGTGTSELFDDYEEGVWTPTQGSFTTWTSPTFAATYTKVGRLVTLNVVQTGGVIGASSAGLYIGGSPYSAAEFSAGSVSDGNINDYGKCVMSGTTIFFNIIPSEINLIFTITFHVA